MRSFCFTILTRYLKIICDCWLKCKMCSNCTIFSSKNHFDNWSKRIWRIFSFERRFISVFSIDEKSLDSSFIDQKAFRSITRVKRIYWTFFYRKCTIYIYLKKWLKHQFSQLTIIQIWKRDLKEECQEFARNFFTLNLIRLRSSTSHNCFAISAISHLNSICIQ